jgi:chaperone modulatory protein CbpM
MTESNIRVAHAVVVEEEVEFTLVELSRVCRADSEQLVALVDEGVLAPSGGDPEHWRFGDASLRRARASLRLTRDLGLNAAGAALVLDLLEENEALRSQVRRLGGR